MDSYFRKFIENISLTSAQKDDAMTKYKGVCKSLYKEFYDGDFSDSVKFLFWSYKKQTTISCKDKDVDLIFKIPKVVFDKYSNQTNWPSNLLTKVKNKLKETYSTTERIKNWTKVVLVDFNSFKVEVLPAFEQDNLKFTIPNSWAGPDRIQDFDPRSEIDDFYESNKNNQWLTRDLIKCIKKWKNNKSDIDIKSYQLDKYVIDFLKNYKFNNYPQLISDFFCYLYSKVSETYVETAKSKANKALEYYNASKVNDAIEEYVKIFWDDFPKTITKSCAEDIAANEEFIENIHLVDINPVYEFIINCRVEQNGHRPCLLSTVLYLLKQKKLTFFIEKNTVPYPFDIKWKVRNYGEEALRANDLRGQIVNDSGKGEKVENTKYRWKHIVECYIIKNDICVARNSITVPIEQWFISF